MSAYRYLLKASAVGYNILYLFFLRARIAFVVTHLTSPEKVAVYGIKGSIAQTWRGQISLKLPEVHIQAMYEYTLAVYNIISKGKGVES